ncbi:MAG: TetR/AcrR family transcriptional regulator [Acidiphilium sp.]
MADQVKEVRTRNPEATRKRILRAAKEEFAKRGLAGARVDTIADRAKSNKGMIYHYFGSKDDLFRAVLEEAYSDIRKAEQALDLEKLSPVSAMETLVRFTWTYYLKNPEFLTLVNSANLHRGKHLSKSQIIKDIHRPFISLVQSIIDRGLRDGVFRPGVDPIQLNITIAAVGYYYLTNRFTGSVIFDRDLMSKEMLQARIDFNVDTVLRLLRKN